MDSPVFVIKTKRSDHCRPESSEEWNQFWYFLPQIFREFWIFHGTLRVMCRIRQSTCQMTHKNSTWVRNIFDITFCWLSWIFNFAWNSKKLQLKRFERKSLFLCQLYGEHQEYYEWFKRYKDGRESVGGDKHLCRSSSSRTTRGSTHQSASICPRTPKTDHFWWLWSGFYRDVEGHGWFLGRCLQFHFIKEILTEFHVEADRKNWVQKLEETVLELYEWKSKSKIFHNKHIKHTVTSFHPGFQYTWSTNFPVP